MYREQYSNNFAILHLSDQLACSKFTQFYDGMCIFISKAIAGMPFVQFLVNLEKNNTKCLNHASENMCVPKLSTPF